MHQFLRAAPGEAAVQLAIIGKYGMGPRLHYLSRLVTSDDEYILTARHFLILFTIFVR
jgi:hypothetical protein